MGVRSPSHLEDVIGALAAEVVLAGQDHHGLAEHLQADGAEQLLLQALHGAAIPQDAGLEIHRTRHLVGAAPASAAGAPRAAFYHSLGVTWSPKPPAGSGVRRGTATCHMAVTIGAQGRR